MSLSLKKLVEGNKYIEEVYIEGLDTNIPLKALSYKEEADIDEVVTKYLKGINLDISSLGDLSDLEELPEGIDISNIIKMEKEQVILTVFYSMQIEDKSIELLEQLNSDVVEEMYENVLRISGDTEEEQAEAERFRE